MKDRSLGNLLEVSKRATAETLIAQGRSVRRIELETVNEKAMGAILMHFMLETVMSADLTCVNPFDQPAVEQGKRLARSMLAGDLGQGGQMPPVAAE